MNAIEVLRDAASRPRDAVRELEPKLDPDLVNEHPGGHGNSIAWLLWHTGREIDVQLAHLTGDNEVWRRDGFRDRFALGDPGDAIGYGHTPEQARAIVVRDPGLLVAYVEAAVDALAAYLDTLSDHDLDDIVDERWTPHVTRGVRLVSIIDDAAQHVAQAAYVAGMSR